MAISRTDEQGLSGTKHDAGFTLLELIVTLMLFAIFVTAVYTALDPLKQLDKAKDARRTSDIKQIATGLDLYYQDNNCYVDQTTLSNFLYNGGTWSAVGGKTIFIKKIPYDPDNYVYLYRTTQNPCPQWGVVFTKLINPPKNTTVCALSKLDNCAPQNFNSSWACVVLGNPNCAELANSAPLNLIPRPGTHGSGGGGSPTSTPTPTITSTPTPANCSKDYACRGTPANCNLLNPAGIGDYCSPNCNNAC